MTFSTLEYCASSAPTHAAIFLHGWGSKAEDLATLAPGLNCDKIKFLFPNAPNPHPYIANSRMWYDLETQAHLARVRTNLKTWVRSLPQQLGIPLENIVLGGFSQGGAMTLDVGHDLNLGGLICLSGYLHPTIQFSAELKKPTLIIHGSEDTVVPVHSAQIIQSEMQQAQWTPEVHVLPMVHTVSPQALKIIQEFLGRFAT